MLITVLLVFVVGVALFYIAGGSIDIDDDVRRPDVNVDWGRLPAFEIDRGSDAQAGDAE